MNLWRHIQKTGAVNRLRKQLEGVNDWLVNAEYAYTDAGDMAEFTTLHDNLDHMLEVVVDLEWNLDLETQGSQT